jgi:hypothetical protein
MKPLLAPARPPHPEILHKALGMSGLFHSNTFALHRDVSGLVLKHLGSLSLAHRPELEESLEEPGRNWLRTYVLTASDRNTGNVTFACNSVGGRYCTTMRTMLFWSCLPADIEAVVSHIDEIWSQAGWSVLYAYDDDDYRLQNHASVCGMEMYGLERDQVEIALAVGGVVEEIDTRANPGYFLNHDGLFWSVQWLNYWNEDSQREMFGELPAELPDGVSVKHLGHGAVRVRLAEKPGRFNDLRFHDTQLRFRQLVPFRLSRYGSVP